jgi:hypothetical protein
LLLAIGCVLFTTTGRSGCNFCNSETWNQ